MSSATGFVSWLLRLVSVRSTTSCLIALELIGRTASAFPVITDVSPEMGWPGTSVTISGTDLGGTSEVQFGLAPAIFTIVSSVTVVATVPLDATSGPISVTTTNGVAVTFGDFLVTPQITDFFPTNAPPGAVILVTGNNFEGATAVLFNGTNASFSVTSPTQLQAVVPTGATSGPITVMTGVGQASSAANFIISGNEPFINSFSPANGSPGTVITISGGNFSGASSVAFNGFKASSFAVTSATQIRATVPPQASTGPISVSNSAGLGTSLTPFVVTTAPVITDFEPAAGGPGTTVVINGVNFSGATSVLFSGVAAHASVNAPTQIMATVPAGATNGPITVITPAGTGSSTFNFLATTAPVISDFEPQTGAPGTPITVNGINFTGVTGVKFNGVSASFGVTAATQLQVVVPSTATSGPITVSSAAGSDTTTDLFLVRSGAPVLTTFSPAAGPSRTVVTLEGLDLSKASAVTFNGVPSTFSVLADTQISAIVPDNATTGPIRVTTPGGTVVSTTPFTVAPKLTGFSPIIGLAGTVVSIQGMNLTGLMAVHFQQANATFQPPSTNQVTATVPDDAVTGSISVITPAGIVATTNFFVVLPTIRQFTPPNGQPGTSVTIFGTGFGNVTGVSFGSVSSSAFTVLSATQIVAIVPAQAVSGPIAVATTSGSALSGRFFAIGAAADLAIGLAQSTNVLLQEQVLTYTVTVTNQGPSPATAVKILDTLPASLSPISVTASAGTATLSGSAAQLNVSGLASGASAKLTIMALTTGAGSITNQAAVSARELDVDLTNNSATLVAQVVGNPAVLQIQKTLPTLTISWPLIATNFVLQSTPLLSSAGHWQTVAITPTISGTQKVIRLPVSGVDQFFRLSRP